MSAPTCDRCKKPYSNECPLCVSRNAWLKAAGRGQLPHLHCACIFRWDARLKLCHFHACQSRRVL